MSLKVSLHPFGIMVECVITVAPGAETHLLAIGESNLPFFLRIGILLKDKTSDHILEEHIYVAHLMISILNDFEI